MTTPKPGDRVRVVIEGTVAPVMFGDARYTWVGNKDNWSTVPIDAAAVPGGTVSVEVLPPPEPEWQPGDVVRDSYGRMLVRVAGYRGDQGETYEWLRDGQPGRGLMDLIVSRPLTLLVRDGKPVAPTGVVTVTGP